MTTSTDASGRNATNGNAANGKGGNGRDGAAAVEALKLLALESAGAADKERRRIIAAAAPVVNVLFRRFLTHDIQAPDWPDRDRFVISSSMQPLACALLHLLGRGQEAEEANDKQEDEAAAAPAEAARNGAGCDLAPRGLDLPLNLPGHGLAAAVGMALATRLLGERFGEEIFNHATCVLVDDRDLEPGIAQETIAITPWLRPHRLCVLHLTAVREDGAPMGRQRCPNHLARLAAAGWHVQQVRADDAAGIAEALEQAADQGVASPEERRPAYVAVEYDATAEVPSTTFLRQELGWEEVPTGDVPGPLRDEWRLVGLRGRKARRAWQERVAELEEEERLALERRLHKPLPEEFRQRMRALREILAEQATARDLQAMLPELLAESGRVMPEMVVLSALHDALPGKLAGELTGELAGDGEQPAEVTEDDDAPSGPKVLDVGLRPMAVAALVAGMAAHGGLRPVGVARRAHLPTMLPMLDEMARAGLSAALFMLDDARCHDVPGALHARGTFCMCPADAVELVECWQLCVQQPEGVGMLMVPAGELPAVRASAEKTNLSALGGYELFRAEGEVKVSLFAAGWTLAASHAVAQALESEGIAAARVVSVPAPHRLAMQDEEHRQRILGARGADGVRLFVPPGAAEHAWSLLECGDSVLSPCASGAEAPGQEQLAGWLREEVLMRLGRLKAEGEQEAARSEAGEQESED